MIKCPITNSNIDIAECVVIVDVSEGCAKETILSDNIKKVENWREICKHCKKHNN
ncbi:hypothetical protein SAMN02745135_00949 [Caloranaerobacter azorensis DSM 13643]|uniref:Uncharacterized protein n=1 Tax=Caloranaerobacter azorensis DSM 13643 TaxID=1121264 RepID=A0A1M5TDI5_9FIRM|nr:hypothetical protein [Caloranaerobacter azorensis]SHH48774.1 hypothetical protein SAMN02745135_00949 [Caloranaerobacter azorensis DSM 13643]